MKTLEAVIKAFECCYKKGYEDPECSECPYSFKNNPGEMYALCAEIRSDALDYLKEYRQAKETLDFEIDRNRKEFEVYKTKWEECEKEKCRLEREIRIEKRLQEDYLRELNDDNPVLTWKELKEMRGKPVWIEADNGQEQFKHWFIIDEFTSSDIPGLQIMWCMNNWFRFWEQDLGKTWQAYRKERE